MQRAIISVYDKNNILKISKFLQEKDIEIISTGGTYKYLKENNINVTEVSDITKFDEILDGRVKTLHPCIHGGILAKRDNVEHMETIKERGIKAIDIVIVNLYPFFEKVKENLSFDEKIEFIDIGGPTMLRAAAKNFKDVIVLCDVNDYEDVMMEIEEKGDLSIEKRQYLASKVFNLMVAYDAAVSEFLNKDNFKSYLNISYKKSMNLRYGENPHQKSSYYVSTNGKGAMRNFQQLNGKELSYNNIKDMDIAWKVVWEFEEDIACCALKHNSPCGVAIGDNVLNAYKKAYECDSVSIFGGIVALNRKVDKESAEEMAKIFLEIIIAPDFDEDALEILRKKKNLRIIKCLKKPEDNLEMAKVDGGILIQDRDEELINSIEVVTDKKPTEEEMKDMIFGMKVVKYVKSNAIVVVKNGTAYGIGGGQVNRIWAAQEALERAKEGSILASDAFFPFKDVVEEAAKYNIKAIIQPGGSIRDKESIEECNRRGISMVFTKMRHFKH